MMTQVYPFYTLVGLMYYRGHISEHDSESYNCFVAFSSKTETGFRNMRSIDDPCFKSKHEPEPVRK